MQSNKWSAAKPSNLVNATNATLPWWEEAMSWHGATVQQCKQGVRMAQRIDKQTHRLMEGSTVPQVLTCLFPDLSAKCDWRKWTATRRPLFWSMFPDLQKCIWSQISLTIPEKNWNRGAAYIHVKWVMCYFKFLLLIYVLCCPIWGMR